ncbi:MAG: hypothetical protein CL693_18295 [Cellvibrionaceae bacterium]|nr:hypothetical protein [Cellvibrionaceae bacterium]|tara:strand:+ start:130 stop:537 length:408 start_codon:yes stop_codon:yes gene_type:complete
MLKKLALSIVVSFLFSSGWVVADEQVKNMKLYLMIGQPNSETWAGIVKNETDMSIDGRKGIEAMGGEMLGFYIGVGEMKNYAIVAFPDSFDVSRIVFTRAMQGVMDDIQFIEIMSTEKAQEVFKAINATQIGGNA